MTEMPETEREECTDCFAQPDADNTRIVYVKEGGVLHEIWHTPDCPQLTIMQFNSEEAHKRVLEQDAWAKGVFPAAHERLKQAAAMPAGTGAQPFVAALTELVQAQADNLTGFVPLHRWAQILERHFPPDLPDPGHTAG
ncbi:hypothetical protein [Streptomyces antimycoticus]